jgi:transcriptional regulator with XRE-family HTH domain
LDRRADGEDVQPGESGIFAGPLNILYSKTGTSDIAVAEALRAAGIRVTAQYLGQIRSGKRHNVGSDVVRGLEAHFDLPPGYFYRSAGAPTIEPNPIIKAVSNPEVAALLLRAGELSPRGLSYLRDLAEQIRKWDLANEERPDGPVDRPAP